MDDSEIVALLFQRNPNAIAQLTKKYGGRLKAVCLNIGVSVSDAEEIENEVYQTAWEKIPPNEPGKYLFYFLAKIAREKSIDRRKANSCKKRSVELLTLSKELEQCIPDSLNTVLICEAKELSGLISDFLRTVSEEKRNIFIRRYWFADSVADISKRYHISQSKVKTVLFRVREELRAYLTKEGYMP